MPILKCPVFALLLCNLFKTFTSNDLNTIIQSECGETRVQLVEHALHTAIEM